MAAATGKPHVSRALSHIRLGVTGAGLGVVVASFLQLVVFGFVHFTDVRFTNLQPTQDRQKLSVVSSDTLGGMSVAQHQVGAGEQEAADVNRVRTAWDVALDRSSGLAVTGGVVSAVTLGLMCFLGVVVAAGGAVLGVEKAVTACTWSFILGVLCLPLGSILDSSSPFPGVFGSYSTMVTSSVAVNAGEGSSATLLATYVLMPIAALCAALMIIARFRSGVEMGIIPESLSEFDEMLEKEMSTIRQRGVTTSVGGRAGAAMRQTMREDAPIDKPIVSEPVTIQEQAPRKIEEPPEAAAPKRKPGRSWISANDRNINGPNPGDPLKRPI